MTFQKVYSDEVIKLTQEVKEYVKSASSWEYAGADLVGIIPAGRLDEIPSYRRARFIIFFK